MKSDHTFHIPVMGTGFSIDTPAKVAKYGISSVISLVDDTLLEQMRELYYKKTGESYTPIMKHDDDFRARRITAYLNLMNRVVRRQFADLKSSEFDAETEITKYFILLPDSSPLKILYKAMLETDTPDEKESMRYLLRNSITCGDICVNIMTKLDRINLASKGQQPLPVEYSDALSALRGYAKSELHSAIVFSAGINRRLYNYIGNFNDFFPDRNGEIEKKIIIKVSDYRSALIQGKYLAKRGLWVSEFRIESGLNRGGHAFATKGHLMGPILEEFKNKRSGLASSLYDICNGALRLMGKHTFKLPPRLIITAQGGIGTANEDHFLRSYYHVDSTGWGTPFLLCTEVTNVDERNLQKLCTARTGDLFLSDVSLLEVPFHNLRESESKIEKRRKLGISRPGSGRPKGHLVSNTEFTKEPICIASRQYQKLKIESLKAKKLNRKAYQQQFDVIVDKSCICNDLGAGVLKKNNISQGGKKHSAVCPGPNITSFSRVCTLRELVDHIYGKSTIRNDDYQPHMFVAELQLYVKHYMSEMHKSVQRQ